MPEDRAAEHASEPPVGPTISASRDQIFITGTGFLPNHRVTVRITHDADDIVDYLTYRSDADGFLSATLPETAVVESENSTVTDHPPDPEGDRGLLWSNTVSITPSHD
jgi:hypothetical protein